LIENLLTFSRFARAPLEKRQVDVADLVERVIAQLRSDPRNLPAEIMTGDLPECCGDPSLLEQVFTNVLSNAFKFTRGCKGARVEVGGQVRDDGIEYVIRDNGVGFDMKYATKLFGVFQRLHSRSDFEGTGIGLSIAQRIVQRHGGRVWAESQPNAGAAFHIRLPA
jgi:light-regulated signal transduction histidine kinase (bacteriophytochrome)